MQNRRYLKLWPVVFASMGLAACDTNFGQIFSNLDGDLRNNAGGLDTSNAVRSAVANRPEPDARGVISYPNYQVAVARPGDTLGDVATRVGGNPVEIASFNGLRVTDSFNGGEIVALPASVAQPQALPGQPGSIDVASVATTALDRAPSSAGGIAPAQASARIDGPEPIRHRVERGETAFSVARLYKVTPRALAEWNGLDAELTVREGQLLLIPVVQQSGRVQSNQSAVPETAPSVPAVESPGEGTPTPTPPSASTPLPDPEPPRAPAPSAPAEPAKLTAPVAGEITKPFAKGGQEWVEIAASPGTPVAAAADGSVAIISRDTEQKTILVLRHANNLLTVYVNIADIAVQKGDRVSAGQNVARIAPDATALHFELREGIESIDPTPLLP